MTLTVTERFSVEAADSLRCVFAAFRILWKKNEVADYEATTFSIFYNNTLFLVLVIIASFFLLKNFNPTVYPLNHNAHDTLHAACVLSER